MRLTNRERLVLALFYRQPWAGTEEELDALLSGYEAAGLDDYESLFEDGPQGPMMRKVPELLASDRQERTYTLPPASMELLLKHVPPWSCPATYGPAKVRLLRKLRSAVGPRKLEAVPDEEAPAESA